ncbi:MraY family glycosyltransferase [Thiohalorhabdus sp. Cl-TMA]|uniref:MraY family glycosyltransferase n=1 Tax=Thiohalorhabdus methylotrophus TaxID=3242694 RepID=A0ABV4TZ73_9GAMM
MVQLFVLCPLAFILALFLIHNLRRPAVRLRLVDIPGGRKAHDGEVPLVGGIGLFATFALVALLLPNELGSYRGLFFGMGILLIAGVLDDLHDIRARDKFIVQMIAAGVLVFWGDLTVAHLGTFPGIGELRLGPLAAPFTLLCVVGLVNAVNMLDGVDGLAGGVVLVVLAWLSLMAGIEGYPQFIVLPAILASAVLAFLVFNYPHPWRPRASVFLGDSGSLLLGFAVAWFTLELGTHPGNTVPPITMAWILALPVFDTVILIGRRLVKGRHPMAADREHLHHIFQRARFTCRSTVYLQLAISTFMGAVGVGSWLLGVPEWVMYVLLLGVFLGHLYFVMHAWRMVRVIRWVRGRNRQAA